VDRLLARRRVRVRIKEQKTRLTIQEHDEDDDGEEYFYYYNLLHVSSNTVLIIMRSNCINMASGIVFSVNDRPVCTPDDHLQTVLYQMRY